MMGERTVMQEALFYGFSLERHVPSDHMLRSIDRFVDLSGVRAHLEPYYSAMGRPSIDPELMIRMLLVGYCFGIRSERRLCEEVHLNLAYRWFCRLGLDSEVPDHSTFSKNRHGRFRDSDLLRQVFETVVARCMAEGLVGGEGFAVDASVITADAHRQRGVTGTGALDPSSNRAVTEYLAVLNDAAFGGATPVEPKFVSPTDPAARWTAASGGPAFYAYSDNYLIDLKHAVIMDVQATTAVRQAEVTAARTMIARTAERFDARPTRLAADTGYGSAEMLAWLVDERKIEPHIPVFDKSGRKDGTFSRDDFGYNHEADVYVCPAGKTMTTTGTPIAAERVVAFYNRRGTCEQYIKDGKNAIKWTRLSCRTFAANAVRLQLHVLAYNLGNFMRTLAMPKAAEPWSLTSLREKLIKIGAKVVSHGRYVTFQLAEVAVSRQMFADILSLVARLRAPPAPA